ncbi:glycosyltransferase family 2 protein [Cobetia amphilecti]|jgi:glycosyltransferase involved in cell wall biosynthesis|uniref:Glycosyltransferase family 2 protein n=1 Tax=Cobetia amphilecti TaxID=1055104 RepID=A0AAP4TZ42_9GAMM|nr:MULTISPECIES: glycosyltransferase family 2 protein [Cobetia]MBR9797042.1 glycosyltransferase family 2 protein [Gammaproteobacteria bacterium]TCJ24531.1 glycosyltransferase family 2 protein [Halomonas sp. GDM18]UTV85556.1 glycosyltransferase family 2 protein [Cobetia litoralis]MBE2169451.1 glycosyltransferase family 2 protein [Cobetia sp. 2AS1]MBS4154071.1 glycosyltransferase family 2 protein [Cobetia sp. MC34]|tara:strand:+ start:833 stop:1678 length:846 start_codon:yes stop_codon:yes gene_type:complete
MNTSDEASAAPSPDGKLRTAVPITGCVITLNEAHNIEDCLRSLAQVCDELIVVDSGSTDATCELARNMGAVVIDQPYLGDGPQKNVGPSHASHRWVLSLDADERLTDGAVSAIRELALDSTPHDGFALRRRNFIGSRWVRHAGWYPDYCLRLYDREKLAFRDSRQHSSVQANHPCELDADLEHYSFANLGELFVKASGRFSNRAAKIMYQKGKRANAFTPFLHASNAFMRKFVFQAGFRDGVDGFSVALSASVNAYLKYAKLLEFQRDAKVREAEDFNKVW